MPGIEVRDMRPADEYFVGTCAHQGESAEVDECGGRRIAWLRRTRPAGVRAKVAVLDGRHAGFAYVIPIEISPWGPEGKDLMVVPCLFVPEEVQGRGVGHALLAATEEEARAQGRRGLVVFALEQEGWWYMPARWFVERGYAEADRRVLDRLLWKPFGEGVTPPRFPERRYRFRPVAGKVVVDLFWNRFCLSSDLEAQRVREVAAEFGERVVLNEYPACEPDVFCEHRIARGIYVDGVELHWGYEAPREGIRDAIREALLDA